MRGRTSSCCSEDFDPDPCSFEVAGMDLGMGVTYLDPGSSQMGKKESIEDTAKVLGMYVASYAAEAGGGAYAVASVPNLERPDGLTHPTQMLADLMMTMEEHFRAPRAQLRLWAAPGTTSRIR